MMFLQVYVRRKLLSNSRSQVKGQDKLLLNKTTYLNERDFVIRMLYRDSYWCVHLCKLCLCQICFTWLL